MYPSFRSFVTTALRIPLKTTRSRGLDCQVDCPGTVWKTETTDTSPSQVFLSRTCPEHGEHTVCISSDARFYWLAKGNSDCGNACACAADPAGATGTLGRNATVSETDTIETISTCLALIEIVDSCNLTWPI
ncbi:MAG: putative radical SAM superfamily Fe-S cluster-containing enzyme [Candidatus Omnitrophota bacterium]|jgi:7,8-dihydro-6-hydroxymethylpterin dimethyltransferase